MWKSILFISTLFSLSYYFLLFKPSQNPSSAAFSLDLPNNQLQYGNQRNYKLLGKLNKGKAGQVFLAQHLVSGDTVAFKLFINVTESMFLTEIGVCIKLQNAPNMLLPRDILRQVGRGNTMQYGIVFDYFEAENYRALFPALSKLQIKHFIYQTLKTLNYAHNIGIVHRDIKPLNVLMNKETLELRVIDWGSSDYYMSNKRKSVRVASLNFKAPELLLGYEYYDYAVDIWSTGCMLAEMVFLKMHFFQSEVLRHIDEENSLAEQLEAIVKIKGLEELREYAERYQEKMDLRILNTLLQNNNIIYEKKPFESFVNEANKHLVDESAIDLLEKMLAYDHAKRITAAEALKHAYFDEVREGIKKLDLSL